MNPLVIPELLTSICYQLDRPSLVMAAQVSKQWSETCTVILWETCPFTAENYNAYSSAFDNHAYLIRTMDAKMRLIGRDMRFIAHQCTNMTELTICHCQFTPASLDILCGGIPRVDHLTLELCRGVNSTIAPRLVRLPRLSHLEVIVHTQERGSGDWREEHIVTLLTRCQLEYLKVLGPDLSHVHLAGVARYENPLQLVFLHLIGTFIPDNALGRLLAKCPRLSTFVLLNNSNKNSTLQEIAKNCPSLRMLELRNSKSVTTPAFDAIFKTCHLLIRLDISCTLVHDAALSTLVRNCPRVQVLDLTGCSRITSVSFLELIATLEELRELRVGGCTRLLVDSFSGTAAWVSQSRLEILDMPSVRIKVGKDSLDGLIRHLDSLTRLRHLTVDEPLGHHNSVKEFLSRRPGVALTINPSALRVFWE
ncbi:putative VIER F-box protein 1 [Mortierella sp. AD031]|nr:putative VIER F-box protein 1 [Mortierella sp. AD031]